MRPGVFEGAHASRNPYTSFPAGAGSLVAGPNGVTLGRFGWFLPDIGQVSSVYTAGWALGFVLPVWGTWNKEYWSCVQGSPPQLILRGGLPCTVAFVGDFWARFQEGAYLGDHVYASPADGSAWSSDPGGYVQTSWLVMSNCDPGGLAVISACQTLN
jgi:hypothetical protein